MYEVSTEALNFFFTETGQRFLRSISSPKESEYEIHYYCMSCLCLFRGTNCKSVSFGIVVIVFELSLQSVSKVAVKLLVPLASNIPTTCRPTRVTATKKC